MHVPRPQEPLSQSSFLSQDAPGAPGGGLGAGGADGVALGRGATTGAGGGTGAATLGSGSGVLAAAEATPDGCPAAQVQIASPRVFSLGSWPRSPSAST